MRNGSDPSLLTGPALEAWKAKMRNLLGFMSARVFRGRLKLILGLVLLVNIIAMFTLPDRLSDVTSGEGAGPLLRWHGGSSGEAEPEGGGLRLVVFGAPDLAMGRENGESGTSKSWTEYLCDEVSFDWPCPCHVVLLCSIRLPWFCSQRFPAQDTGTHI